MPRIYDRLLALTEEAITTLRTVQETQAESQRNAMASRAANDSIKAFYDSQTGALGDELPRLRQDLAKAGEVIRQYRDQDMRIADLLGAEPDADLVEAVEDLCKKAATPHNEVKAFVDGRRVQAERDAALLREKAETAQPAASTAAVMCWCAYLIDTDDETPMTLREWLNGRGKS